MGILLQCVMQPSIPTHALSKELILSGTVVLEDEVGIFYVFTEKSKNEWLVSVTFIVRVVI